jgi:hypothetical protein
MVGVRVTVGVVVIVAVGVIVVVGVSVIVGVSVSVSVGVSVAVDVIVAVEVMVGVEDAVAVNVGRTMVAGRPTTRATRNCSTIPSRRADSRRLGHHMLSRGVIKGWSWSTVTDTRSPGRPALSPGAQSADEGMLVFDGV